MAQYLQFDYFSPMIDLDEYEGTKGFLSKPEKLKMYIDEKGLLKVKGKRYLRLGKISLFDSVKDKSISSKKFVGILDTNTGEIQCFDINEIYEKYIQDGINKVRTPDDKTYNITTQTKEIVMNEINQRKSDADIPVDFV